MTIPTCRQKARTALLVLTCSALIFGSVQISRAQVQSCSQTLNAGDNVASAVSSASSGSTICLNSGNYGTVTLGSFTKNPPVTVRSVSGQGAALRLRAQNGANGVTFDNITFNGDSTISGSSTKNVTIQNSNFGTNQLDIATNNFNENNILIDHNTFGAYNADACEGRLCIHWGGGPGSVPAGVVVTNNTFGPGGCSDGIQIGSYGVVVGPGNVFTGMVQSGCTQHVDAIQGYGQSHTTVTGNYFINNSVDLGFYDGGNAEVFTHNVIQHSSSTGSSGQLGTIRNPIFQHNTVKNATISFNGKPENGPSSNLLMQDNIFIGSSKVSLSQNGTPACTNCTVTHNLFDSSGNASGTNNIIGAPTFLGGTSPSTWAGYQLATGSLGKNSASDGLDMGTTYYGQGGISQPPPTPAAPKNLIILP